MQSFMLPNVEVIIKKGDITDENVEAIVNAANNHFWMGGGVAGAIKRKGGIEIEKEAMRKGPVEVGNCVVTSAGRLYARYVIHAAVMGQDLKTDANKIAQCTLNAIKIADAYGVKSIAFPALGTGVGGVDYTACAEAMLSAIEKFVGKHVSKVIFVLFGDEAFNAFLNIARRRYG
ncbi:MAG: macro domain-containing protein [Thermoplasmata archaeon]